MKKNREEAIEKFRRLANTNFSRNDEIKISISYGINSSKKGRSLLTVKM